MLCFLQEVLVPKLAGLQDGAPTYFPRHARKNQDPAFPGAFFGRSPFSMTCKAKFF